VSLEISSFWKSVDQGYCRNWKGETQKD